MLSYHQLVDGAVSGHLDSIMSKTFVDRGSGQLILIAVAMEAD